MKSEKLLEVIGEAKEEYVLSALESRDGNKYTKKTISFKRALLIAAIIALTLLLVSCAVAYVLHLQDFKIAESDNYTWSDSKGNRVDKAENVLDILSIHSTPGSPNQLAAKEWLEYTSTCELDEKLIGAEKDPEIPDNLYYTYQCHTKEQVSKLLEISEKYHLNILGSRIDTQSQQTKIVFDAMGISGICHNKTSVQEKVGSGLFYPESDFRYECEIVLNTAGAYQYPITTVFYYSPKEYFDPEYLELPLGDFEQWNYTTKDGTKVLIAEDFGSAIIFTETNTAYITVFLINDLPQSDAVSFTKSDIEFAVDGLNFQMHPKSFDIALIQPLLDAADAGEEQLQRRHLIIKN